MMNGEKLISAVVHDVKNPMTAVRGLCECILSGAIPEDEIRPTIRNMLSELERMERLLDGMLDVSRLSDENAEMAFEDFDLSELIRLVMISLSYEGEKKEIDALLSLPDERVIAYGNRDSIHRVVYNLLHNAIKFSPFGGRIDVSIESEGGVITVSVKNEGSGISAEDRERIFEKFFRSPSLRETDSNGVGLGLYISKAIMDAHKQKITVDSEEGSWCAFTFTLECGRGTERINDGRK